RKPNCPSVDPPIVVCQLLDVTLVDSAVEKTSNKPASNRNASGSTPAFQGAACPLASARRRFVHAVRAFSRDETLWVELPMGPNLEHRNYQRAWSLLAGSIPALRSANRPPARRKLDHSSRTDRSAFGGNPE